MSEILINIRELDEVLCLTKHEAYRLMRKGVFEARQEFRVWKIPESSFAEVADRILRYRDRRPFYPMENMTIAEAAEALRVTEGAIYGMGRRGELDWAQNELWHMPTRASVNHLCRRKGMRPVA